MKLIPLALLALTLSPALPALAQGDCKSGSSNGLPVPCSPTPPPTAPKKTAPPTPTLTIGRLVLVLK